jgi:hypothetical protein
MRLGFDLERDGGGCSIRALWRISGAEYYGRDQVPITPLWVFINGVSVMHDAGSIVLDLGPSGLSRIARDPDERFCPKPKGLNDSRVSTPELFTQLGGKPRLLENIARWQKNTGWKPMLHWFSGLLSDLSEPSW